MKTKNTLMKCNVKENLKHLAYNVLRFLLIFLTRGWLVLEMRIISILPYTRTDDWRTRKMSVAYEKDIIAWANEQAGFIRAGRFDLLDLENIAEEIEDVGKSEKRELASRMAVLLSHLLKWQFQPGRRGASWQRTIKEQRKAIALEIRSTPSLKVSLNDVDWLAKSWADAVARAGDETGLDVFPESCSWTTEQILDQEFFPI